jgi:hypothetical protein
MRSEVEQSVRLGSVFLHEDVCSLRGSREFQVRDFFCLSFEWFSLIKDYNTKVSTVVEQSCGGFGIGTF